MTPFGTVTAGPSPDQVLQLQERALRRYPTSGSSPRPTRPSVNSDRNDTPVEVGRGPGLRWTTADRQNYLALATFGAGA